MLNCFIGFNVFVAVISVVIVCINGFRLGRGLYHISNFARSLEIGTFCQPIQRDDWIVIIKSEGKSEGRNQVSQRSSYLVIDFLSV